MTNEKTETPEEQIETPPVAPGEVNIDYKDKYLRLLAEMENTRKRMQKEKQESMRYATEQLLCEMIAPLDNLENALQFTDQMSEEVRHWAMGFKMILEQFKTVLQENGVTSFQSEGQKFDPHLHEAVETEETDKAAEGIVLKQFAKGYKYGDRTIRPARVRVAKNLKGEQV
jgi:molecular chaperone GrpE